MLIYLILLEYTVSAMLLLNCCCCCCRLLLLLQSKLLLIGVGIDSYVLIRFDFDLQVLDSIRFLIQFDKFSEYSFTTNVIDMSNQ